MWRQPLFKSLKTIATLSYKLQVLLKVHASPSDKDWLTNYTTDVSIFRMPS